MTTTENTTLTTLNRKDAIARLAAGETLNIHESETSTGYGFRMIGRFVNARSARQAIMDWEEFHGCRAIFTV